MNFSLGATGDGRALAAIAVDRRVEESELASLRSMRGILSIEML